MTGTNADNRSTQLYHRAGQYLVGGVNSPVRAFDAVGGDPLFIERAAGACVYDADGREYIDLVGSWGPAIVGHAHPEVVGAVQRAAERGLSFGACCASEADLAELILSALPDMQRLRFVSSGTEAVMTAIRLARAVTGRDKIIKFAGCYHGHSDALLVAAGSGAATFGVADSTGVTAGAVRDTIVLPYNDIGAVRAAGERAGDALAAVLVEPIAGNMGYVEPHDGFLAGLRSVCDDSGALLIFDEVMTGFRVAWGGCQTRMGIRPDLTCLGKVIGGGLPCAAVAGRRAVMDHLSPAGSTYQAGTLSGNPVAMAAGLATLRICRQPGFYDRLESAANRLIRGIARAAGDVGLTVATGATGGLLGVAFADRPVRNFDDARRTDHDAYARFFRALRAGGVFLPPSGYEAMFISQAHDDAVIDRIIAVAADSMKRIGP